MNIEKISLGSKIPEEFPVIIEIPTGGIPVKYEVDKDSGALVVDRFLGTAMYYPCNYGFIPHTLADDGDPLDALVLTPTPIISGAVIQCRTVGVLMMEDEAGKDEKLLCVPITKLTTLYKDIKNIDNLPESMVKQVVHFFEHYKDLEEGKWVKITGYETTDTAKKLILRTIETYKKNK